MDDLSCGAELVRTTCGEEDSRPEIALAVCGATVLSEAALATCGTFEVVNRCPS
jgi:hypothetical protein